MRRPCACGLLIRLPSPGDRKVLIRIFGFDLVLSFSDAGAPKCAEGVGDKQGRKTDGLASSMVWLWPIPTVPIGDNP